MQGYRNVIILLPIQNLAITYELFSESTAYTLISCILPEYFC